MNKFRAWYLRNQVEITWFLIGWLVLGGLYDFGRGEYINAVILWTLAAINYSFAKRS